MIGGSDFPGERLMACLDPRLREERARRRKSLHQAAEEALEAIVASVRSGRLKGREAIDRRVGRDANRRKVGNHFEIDVTDDGVSWSRQQGLTGDEMRRDRCIGSRSCRPLPPISCCRASRARNRIGVARSA